MNSFREIIMLSKQSLNNKWKNSESELSLLSCLLPIYLVGFILYNLLWTIIIPVCHSELANPTGILQLPPILTANNLPYLFPCYR